MLKLFNKTHGMQVIAGDTIASITLATGKFVEIEPRYKGNYIVTEHESGRCSVNAIYYPDYEIKDVPQFGRAERIHETDAIAVPVGSIPNDITKTYVVGVGHTDVQQLIVDGQLAEYSIYGSDFPAADIGKPDDYSHLNDLPKVDKRLLSGKYTPLSEALLKFFDAGYTAHRVFDHDRSVIRSVHFKRGGKTTLMAHVEIIDGNRYIRNSIFNMLS